MFSASNGQNILHVCVSVQEFSCYHLFMNHMKFCDVICIVTIGRLTLCACDGV